MEEQIYYIIINAIEFIMTNKYVQFILSFFSTLLFVHIVSIIFLKIKPNFKFKELITLRTKVIFSLLMAVTDFLDIV